MRVWMPNHGKIITDEGDVRLATAIPTGRRSTRLHLI